MACAVLSISMSACDKTKEPEVEKLAPDRVITAEKVTAITGIEMQMDEAGVTTIGNASSVTYVSEPAYSGDPVTVKIEQFSDSLDVQQVWKDYELNRIPRESDLEHVEGIGEDCYIAFPYINVYNRGCYIRISAGSGNDDQQRELLKTLATIAVGEVDAVISAEAYENARGNVIK